MLNNVLWYITTATIALVMRLFLGFPNFLTIDASTRTPFRRISFLFSNERHSALPGTIVLNVDRPKCLTGSLRLQKPRH